MNKADDGNGWNEHKLAIYQRLDTIDITNQKQTEVLEKIHNSQNDIKTELKVFKSNMKYVIGIGTAIVTAVYHTAVRLITGGVV